MRLDSHQHFWKYNATDYIWMGDKMDVLRRDHLPVELESELNTIGFDGTIAVQARQMVAETEWLLELADRHDFIRGVVGWVDFESDDLEQQLQQYGAHPKLKGVRELIHDMPDVDYATSEVHVRAITKLAGHDLSYDLLLKPPHIRPAIQLVRRFPEQRFVVDHIAKPDIAASVRSPWQTDLEELAWQDNVYCKLSGMVTEARWHDWTPKQFHPYLDVALAAFGPQRLMIGSDWPVCTLCGRYEEVMGIVIEYVERLSADESEAILGATCARFYGVSDVTNADCKR
jgi:L-fuconolactonase